LAGGLLLRISTLNIRWRKIAAALAYLIAAVLCGIGLFKSYSRGAWLGTAFGLTYLSAKHGMLSAEYGGRRSGILWLHKKRLSLFVTGLSVVVLCFWQFRFTEWLPAHRVFSVVNIDDFSWRNRIAAWSGAVHMMMARPLIGFGWGQAESVFERQYLPPQLTESAAIQMNDFLMLGVSAGVPALVCFVVNIWSALGRGVAKVMSPDTRHLPLRAVCRAGVIVLLVGFWFDGGLFKLSVGPIFWVLLGLSKLEPLVGREVTSLSSGGRNQQLETGNQPETPCVVSCSKKGIWPRRLAWGFATIAAVQTTVYLGIPFLPLSKGTLAIARKCLIPPKETGDFDFLSAKPIWEGKPLKILLEHVNLANYNRQLVSWQVDDKMYLDCVLSPVITPNPQEQLNWRRPLWGEFYPLIRNESSPEDAARIVVQHLRERVTIADVPNLPHDATTIWSRQITDKEGFEIIYVAALRSVGVPARLNSQYQAEFWDGAKWDVAPSPAVLKQ